MELTCTDNVNQGGEESLDGWFRREVLPHEDSLRRFLSQMWDDPAEIADLCHDAYIRVYEAAKVARPHNPRQFLFTTARHIVIDRLRRKRVVAMQPLGPQHCEELLIDSVCPERHAIATSEFGRLIEAIAGLPPRSREVLWLRRVRELSQRQAAQTLGVSEKAVEKHLRVATQRLLQLVET